MSETDFRQIVRMTDARGIFEHADGADPRIEHGYCLDDNARALVVACRQRPVTPTVEALVATYLRFVVRAQGPDGACHNRLDPAGRWTDEASTGDWWGRALWGLGTAAVLAPQPWARDMAFARFGNSAHRRSPDLHAMAFASLGAAEILSIDPNNSPARDLLAAAASCIGRPDFGSRWPWPEPSLRYANAAIPEALIAAGSRLADDNVLEDGLRLLSWLLTIETLDGRLSVAPADGWAPGSPRPAFDQQPIEVAAIADACGRAWQVTGDPSWRSGVEMAVGWFHGDNDRRIAMFDPRTGGGFDGLTPNGVNSNQGAESTLAMLMTLQHTGAPVAS